MSIDRVDHIILGLEGKQDAVSLLYYISLGFSGLNFKTASNLFGGNVQTAEQLIVLSSQAVSCELGGETVILDIPSGQYFALTPIGTQIWKLLEVPSTLASVCSRLVEEYEVEPAHCEADVSALLSQLSEHGLLTFKVSDGH